jgi:ABC-2 type transport system permease protein
MEEQSVMMMGIPPLTLNVVERDKQEVAKIYLGMAVLYGDTQQIIPVVKRPESLEYELAEAIIKVSSEQLPGLAWWKTGSEDVGEQDSFNFIKHALSGRYRLDEIAADDVSGLFPDTHAALILTSSNAMPEAELMAIDQYLMNGGRVIALLDRYAITPSMTAVVLRSNVLDAFAHYGARVSEALVLDQSNAVASFSGGPVTYHLPYAFWPDIRNSYMNSASPLVSDLETVVLPWTSPLVLADKDNGGLEEDVLATSSPFSTLKTGESIQIDPQGAGESLASSERKQSVMIAMLSGPFDSYFAGEKRSKDPLFKTQSGPLAKIFIVGSARWAGDSFLQNFPANAALFENAVDSFAMGDFLIGIRSRESSSKPLEIISDASRLAVKYINLAFGPVIIAMIGILVFMRRRSRKNMLKFKYGKI